MTGGVFLIQPDGELVEMTGQLFDSEDRLQALIATHPGLLAGDQIDSESPRRLLLLKRELGVPSGDGSSNRWAVDHLFVDQDGIPTFVEVKRSTDTRIRREVVGQLIEYAANAVEYWPIQLLQQSFDATCKDAGREPQTVLAAHLAPGMDPEGFWKKVEQNLEDGVIRLLFVADDVPPELRRIVEFLNQQMEHVEVLAVEVKQFVGQKMTTLVPRLIGQTEQVRRRKTVGGRVTRQWDEPSFFAALEANRGPKAVTVARRILDWANRNAPPEWGNGKRDGSFIPIITGPELEYYPIAVYSYGRIEIQFQHLIPKPPFDSEAKRRELLAKLNGIEGVSLPLDSISRRPSIMLETLVDGGRLTKFLSVLDWVKSQAA